MSEAGNNIRGHSNNRPCSHTWIWRDCAETRQEFSRNHSPFATNTCQQECMSWPTIFLKAARIRQELLLHINCYHIQRKHKTLHRHIYLGFILYCEQNIGQEGVRSQGTVESDDPSHERPEDHQNMQIPLQTHGKEKPLREKAQRRPRPAPPPARLPVEEEGGGAQPQEEAAGERVLAAGLPQPLGAPQPPQQPPPGRPHPPHVGRCPRRPGRRRRRFRCRRPLMAAAPRPRQGPRQGPGRGGGGAVPAGPGAAALPPRPQLCCVT